MTEPEKSRQPATVKLVVPLQLLRSHPEDGVMLVRLGQAVNAVSTFASLLFGGLLSTPLREGESELSRSRAKHQVYLTGAAYMSEAVKLLDEYGNRPWTLAELAVSSGAYEFDLDTLKKMLGTSADSIHAEFLKRWRDKTGFHWDAKPVREVLEQVQGTDELELWHWRFPPFRNPNNYSNAAMKFSHIQMFHGLEEPDMPRSRALAAAQFALAVLYEGILFGFLLELRLNPFDYIQDDSETGMAGSVAG